MGALTVCCWCKIDWWEDKEAVTVPVAAVEGQQQHCDAVVSGCGSGSCCGSYCGCVSSRGWQLACQVSVYLPLCLGTLAVYVCMR